MATRHHTAQSENENVRIKNLTLILVMWTDGYTGERIEEPANPGQADAARNGQNKRAIPKETKNEHIWLKFQNVGSCEETNERHVECRHGHLRATRIQSGHKNILDAKLNSTQSRLDTTRNDPVRANTTDGGATAAAGPYAARNSWIARLQNGRTGKLLPSWCVLDPDSWREQRHRCDIFLLDLKFILDSNKRTTNDRYLTTMKQ